MPRLPDVTSLGERPVPRGRTPIISDRSGEIAGQAIESTGENLIQLSNQREQRLDRIGYAQARSSLLQADIATRRELENDNDFTTYESRYREKLGKARQDASQFIRGRTDRALFEQDTAADLERGVSEVRGLARRKEVDTGRSSLAQMLQANRTAAMDATDEGTRAALIASTNEAITGAKERGYVSAQEATDQRKGWTTDYAQGVLELQPPAKRLQSLKNPGGTAASLLDADVRSQLIDRAEIDLKREQVAAEAARTESLSNSIIGAYAKNGPEAGVAALAKLAKSGMSQDALGAVYSKVSAGVSRLRDVQQQAHADDIAGLYASIQSNQVDEGTFLKVEDLWDAGALTPLERASLVGRIEEAHLTGSKQTALATEVREAIATGTPLDPSSGDQRKGVAAAFAADSQGAAVGSDSWQALASAYAVRTRMLPEQATSWVRSAIRSPDPKVAGPAVQFFGAVSSAAPDAVSSFDTATKAFAGMASGMIDAGTPPEKAIEVARQTTMEQPATVLKSREDAYRKVTDSDSALSTFIDRDFDTAFTSQPDATAGLKQDFASQAGRYYQYTGNLQAARDLAWADVKRIYGVSEVNGSKQMMALPPERFGVKPEEVRADIASVLSGTTVTVEDAMKSVHRTELPASQEKDYRAWLNRIGMTKEKGYRLDSSYTGEDYDMRGFFKKYGPVDVNVKGGQHFTDEFKLPNHETFSNQSMYAKGPAAELAGTWNGDTYVPPTKRKPVALPDGSTVDDIRLVPDSLTLRQVTSIMDGKPVLPSYKLVTKTGELMLNEKGIPLRYTLPNGEQLSQRLRDAEEKAAGEAQRRIDQARFDRDTTRKRRQALELR